jgi:predicted acylesterase/phospholipase RssA
MIDTLVFSGGGMKCTSFIGVLQKIEELHIKDISKFNIKTICAVSAGTFIALMYILGYTSKEMEKIFYLFDFSKFREIN